MEKIVSSFTVFFEEPFWVGVYERNCGGRVSACRVVFGPEPKDYMVYEYLLKNDGQLRFSPPVKAGEPGDLTSERKMNPKRVQRQISAQLLKKGVGTKAQQALALAREEGKLEKRARSREQRELERERLFQLKQEKKKQKHRGR